MRMMRLALMSLIALALAGCAAGGTAIYPPSIGQALTQLDVDALVRANPAQPGEEVHIITVGRTASASYHVVIIPDRETPHVHQTHDGTILVLRGTGTLYLGAERLAVHPGSLLVIPRNVPHYFVNAGPAPAVGYVVWSPPMETADRVAATMPESHAP